MGAMGISVCNRPAKCHRYYLRKIPLCSAKFVAIYALFSANFFQFMHFFSQNLFLSQFTNLFSLNMSQFRHFFSTKFCIVVIYVLLCTKFFAFYALFFTKFVAIYALFSAKFWFPKAYLRIVIDIFQVWFAGVVYWTSPYSHFLRIF